MGFRNKIWLNIFLWRKISEIHHHHTTQSRRPQLFSVINEMGINKGGDLYASLKSLSINHVKYVLQNKHRLLSSQENSREISIKENDSINKIRADVDINWLLYKKCNQAKTLPALLQSCTDYLLAFAKCGIIVTPICDPDEHSARHHSKCKLCHI